MKGHIEAAHRLGRSRPRWSLQGGRRPAGSSAPSSPPGSCETPPRLPPEPGKSDMRHILLNFGNSGEEKTKNIGSNLQVSNTLLKVIPVCAAFAVVEAPEK